ncbi:hypothetical protein JCM10450v2_005405 [Rhodotorula kratochvilovae]
MADSPRQNTQTNRQARRPQPYARPAAPEPQSTPSRLRSLLSYVSPFRSARKAKEPSPKPANDEDEMEDGEHIKDEHDSADEAAQFALHGRLLTRAGDFNEHAPPSPSPGTGSSTQRSLGSSLASSVTMPNLAALASTSSSLATPRFPGALARSPSYAHFADAQSAYTAESAVASTSSHATQELARFFQDKAERGEDHLSAVEQAGVLQLMQQSQTEAALPTAFTPKFRSSQPAFLSQPASQVPSSAGSIFDGAASSVAGGAIAPVAAKRRRPIYVGAGYSSRRRRTGALGGLVSSQSESALSSLAGPSTDGKRRRTGADREDEDDIPVATLDDIVASPARASPASPARKVEPAAVPQPKPSSAQPKFGGASSASASTPAKPSPLWQVSSQSESATPTPPRKASAQASTPPTATRAADLVMEVIRQEDEARRAATPTAPKRKKDAILNPYAGAENPLALAGRVARKEKPKPASPKPSQRVSKVVAEIEKIKEKEVSPLEQLERTMPAEYRRKAKRASASPPPAPKPAAKPAQVKADKKGKKPVAVVTLSSSDNEDEEMGAAEEEEPENDEEEEEEDVEEEDQLEEDEDEELPAPKAAFSFGAPASKVKASEAPKPAFSFGASSSGFSSAPAAPAAPAPAQKSAFSFAPSASATPEPTDGAQALLALSGAAPAPAPGRTLTPAEAGVPLAPPVFPPASAAPAKDAEEVIDPREAARALSKAQLPLVRFSFAGVGATNARKVDEGDKAREAVKDLVRAMGRGELPTFAF